MFMHWECQQKFFKYFIKDKKALTKYFVLSLIVGVLELFGVALTYPFINRLISGNSTGKVDSESLLLGMLIIGAFLIKNCFMIFYNYLQANFVKNCETTISARFMEYFIYSNYSDVSKISCADKLHTLNFLPQNSINNFLIRILNLNVNIFIFTLLISFLFIKFFTATIITLICSLVLIMVQTFFFKNKTAKFAHKIIESNKELSQACNEPLLNLKSTKIMNAEDYFFKKYSDKLHNFKQNLIQQYFYSSIPPYVTEPIVIILIMVLLSVISYQNISNPASLVASYAVIASAAFRLVPTISRIQVNLTSLNATLPTVKELVDLYEKYGLNDGITKTINKEPIRFNKCIELRGLSFCYEENKKALNNINLKINKGEFIGIAGHSGAGKTTLADIFAGVLEFKCGEIYIDSKLINGQNMPKLNIGYIPQDYKPINTSIRENVAFSEDNIDDARVIDSLKKARLYDFITTNYEDGIYANPFIDNVGMSQGQKQRLAIARALYKNPDIIILDEATSSLDLKTEDEICEVLNNLKGDKTIIAIAHRLSTIKSSDKIIYMQASSISAIGSFEEVYATNPDFKELVDLNYSSFVKNP